MKKLSFVILFLFHINLCNARSYDTPSEIKKYSCDFNKESPEAVLMNAYLIAKHSSWLQSDYRARNKKTIKLIDDFVSPSYLRKNRITPGSAEPNLYSARTNPETLICLKKIKNNTKAITSLMYDQDNGVVDAIRIFSYRIQTENDLPYILPTSNPRPQTISRNEEDNALYWIDLSNDVDFFTRLNYAPK